jgi:hypothetical protein
MGSAAVPVAVFGVHAASPENSPAIYGWDSSPAIVTGQCSSVLDCGGPPPLFDGVLEWLNLPLEALKVRLEATNIHKGTLKSPKEESNILKDG